MNADEINSRAEEWNITPEELMHLLVQKKEVCQRIYAAFADNQYPSDEAIGISDEICNFIGRDWRDTSAEGMESGDHWAIHFFTARDSATFFQRSFLLACLDTNRMDMITYSFIPPCYDNTNRNTDERWERFKERFDGLSAEKYQCMAKYIEYCQAEINFFENERHWTFQHCCHRLCVW